MSVRGELLVCQRASSSLFGTNSALPQTPRQSDRLLLSRTFSGVATVLPISVLYQVEEAESNLLCH